MLKIDIGKNRPHDGYAIRYRTQSFKRDMLGNVDLKNYWIDFYLTNGVVNIRTSFKHDIVFHIRQWANLC